MSTTFRRAGARRALRATALALLTLLLALGLGTNAASAHADLVATDPVAGSVVASAPTTVTLVFSEAVSLRSADSVRVLDPQGLPVDAGDPHLTGKGDQVQVTVKAAAAHGTYTVAWRVISEDSHAIGGAFTFSVGAPSSTSVKMAAVLRPDPLVEVLDTAARTAAYLAFALLAGAVAFTLVCWPAAAATRALQRLLMTGWCGLFLASTAVLLLRGPYDRGTGLAGAGDFSLLRATVEGRFGQALLARLLLLVVAGALLSLLLSRTSADDRQPHAARTRAFLAAAFVILGCALCATWSVAGHSSAGVQPGLALPLDMAHTLAMGVWLGGLVCLLALVRSEMPAQAVRRYSRVALVCMAVLVATGLYQSWRDVGSWSALFGTLYGRLLLAKSAGVVTVLAAARLSRSRTRHRAPETSEAVAAGVATPRAAVLVGAGPGGAEPGPPRAAPADRAPLRLRGPVLTEAVAAVAVVALTAVLTATPPGRSAEAAARAAAQAARPVPAGRAVELTVPYSTGGSAPGARGTAVVSLGPAAVGRNELTLRVTGADGQAVDVPEVQVAFTLPDRDLGPLQAPLARAGTGQWSAEAFLPIAGEWMVSVTVRSSDIDQVTESKPLKVG
nr:copper resistance protein CopC [Kitasatospora purpeofusca]